MKKIITILSLIMIMGCSLNQEPEEKVPLFILEAQSNGTPVWREAVKEEILEIYPNAIVVWSYYPGNSIVGWSKDGVLQDNYYKSMKKILDAVEEVNYDFMGFFWFQGESDRDNWLYYERSFNHIIESLGEDLQDDNFNIFMNIVYGSYANITPIRRIQYNMCITEDYRYEDAFLYDRGIDGVHLLPEEADRIGRDIVLNNLDLFK